jgi:hypothetical protein
MNQSKLEQWERQQNNGNDKEKANGSKVQEVRQVKENV